MLIEFVFMLSLVFLFVCTAVCSLTGDSQCLSSDLLYCFIIFPFLMVTHCEHVAAGILKVGVHVCEIQQNALLCCFHV